MSVPVLDMLMTFLVCTKSLVFAFMKLREQHRHIASKITQAEVGRQRQKGQDSTGEIEGGTGPSPREHQGRFPGGRDKVLNCLWGSRSL